MEYPVFLFVFVWCSFGLVAGLSNQPDTHDDSLPIADLAVITGLTTAVIVVGIAVFDAYIERQSKRRETAELPKTPRKNDYLKQHVNPANVSNSGNNDDKQDAALVLHQRPTPTTATTNSTTNDDIGIDCILTTIWLFFLLALCLICLLSATLCVLMNTWEAVCLIALVAVCQAALLHGLARRRRLTYWEEHVNGAYVSYDGNDDDYQDSALARHQRPTPTTATTNNTNNDDTHVVTGLNASADGDYDNADSPMTQLLYIFLSMFLTSLKGGYMFVLTITCLDVLLNGMLFVWLESNLAVRLAIQLSAIPIALVDFWLLCFVFGCVADFFEYWLAGYQALWLAVCLTRASRPHEIHDSPASVV